MESPFRLFLGFGFITVVAITLRYRLKSFASKETLDRRQEGAFILATLRPAGLALWGAAIAYLLNPAWMAWSSIPLSPAARWLGVVPFAVGLVLLQWTLQSLGVNLTDTVVTRKVHTLITHGPYRYVRHPFYDTLMLLVVGMAMLAANWFIAASGVVVFILLAVRSTTEEAKLAERFGEPYRAYQRGTGRFLPRLTS